MKRIPRSLAFDMLFGSNRGDAHAVLDEIYKGFEVGTCGDCFWCEEMPTSKVEYLLCKNNDVPHERLETYIRVNKTFGCNKFEAK